jgi:Cys/Met metabolism PLP-dependent enzyme
LHLETCIGGEAIWFRVCTLWESDNKCFGGENKVDCKTQLLHKIFEVFKLLSYKCGADTLNTSIFTVSEGLNYYILSICSSLERAESTLFVSSGMGAIVAVLLSLVPTGSHVVATKDCYWEARMFIQNKLSLMGVSVSFLFSFSFFCR